MFSIQSTDKNSPILILKLCQIKLFVDRSLNDQYCRSSIFINENIDFPSAIFECGQFPKKYLNSHQHLSFGKEFKKITNLTLYRLRFDVMRPEAMCGNMKYSHSKIHRA